MRSAGAGAPAPGKRAEIDGVLPARHRRGACAKVRQDTALAGTVPAPGPRLRLPERGAATALAAITGRIVVRTPVVPMLESSSWTPPHCRGLPNGPPATKARGRVEPGNSPTLRAWFVRLGPERPATRWDEGDGEARRTSRLDCP